MNSKDRVVAYKDHTDGAREKLPVKIVAAGGLAVYMMPPRTRAATGNNSKACGGPETAKAGVGE
jgi:hypothetical protein